MHHSRSGPNHQDASSHTCSLGIGTAIFGIDQKLLVYSELEIRHLLPAMGRGTQPGLLHPVEVHLWCPPQNVYVQERVSFKNDMAKERQE